MRSHHSFKPTFYLEYFYVQAGTAIRTVSVKISEVLYKSVSCSLINYSPFTLHQILPNFLTLSMVVFWKHPEMRKQWMLCFPSSFSEEPLTALRCSSILTTWTWFITWQFNIVIVLQSDLWYSTFYTSKCCRHKKTSWHNKDGGGSNIH